MTAQFRASNTINSIGTRVGFKNWLTGISSFGFAMIICGPNVCAQHTASIKKSEASSISKATLAIHQSPKSDILYLGPKTAKKEKLPRAKLNTLLYGANRKVMDSKLTQVPPALREEKPAAAKSPATVESKVKNANHTPKDQCKKSNLLVKYTTSKPIQIETQDPVDQDQEPIIKFSPVPKSSIDLATSKSKTTIKVTPASTARPYSSLTDDDLSSLSHPAELNLIQEKMTPKPVAQNQWKLKKVSDIQLSNSQTGLIPKDSFQSDFPEASTDAFWPRNTIGTTAFWDAPNICYHRLYTEDPLLERYGQSACRPVVQVGRSAAHFGISAFRAPALFLKDRRGIRTPIGFQRPGAPVPNMYQRLFPIQ